MCPWKKFNDLGNAHDNSPWTNEILRNVFFKKRRIKSDKFNLTGTEIYYTHPYGSFFTILIVIVTENWGSFEITSYIVFSSVNSLK